MTSVVGWAAELAQKLVYDALDALGPASIGAQLLRQGLVLSMDGLGQVSCPGFVADQANAGFVAEGNPIPVRQMLVGNVTLLPYKLAAISVLTREMIESSNAERLIGDALMRSAGIALDTALLDSTAATSARPAGLRNGIVALTPSASTDPFEQVFEDIAMLVNSISAVAGNGPHTLIAAPGRASMMRARFTSDVREDLSILGSSAVGNDLLAVGPAALVSALSPTPNIEAVSAGTIVMDTVPGAAGTTASGEKSMFQTDSFAIKMRWPVSWVLRDARGVAWLTPTWK
jgi:hypothetical protein